MKSISDRQAFGKKILGPILYDFCRKLYIYQLAYEGKAVCLFAYRGGVRLLHLYEIYLSNIKRSAPVPQHGFLTSRICAMKCTIKRAYSKAEKILLREYSGESVQQIVNRLMPHTRLALPDSIGKRIICPDVVRQMVFGSDAWAKEIQEYFSKQEMILRQYIETLIGSKMDVLFIDTGWSGTTQSFLMQGFRQVKWHGVYFGKWDTWRENPKHFYAISGLYAEGTKYSYLRPETAVFNYHHIIEGPLEPKIPSVEELKIDSRGRVCSSSFIDKQMIAPQHDEKHFLGICDYFLSSAGKSIDEIAIEAYRAKINLRKMIIRPNRSDVGVMVVNPRSADFGKKRIIPILAQKSDRRKLLSRILNIKKSIWRQGKIVNDFPIFYPVLLLAYNNLDLINPKYIERFFSVLRR